MAHGLGQAGNLGAHRAHAAIDGLAGFFHFAQQQAGEQAVALGVVVAQLVQRLLAGAGRKNDHLPGNATGRSKIPFGR